MIDTLLAALLLAGSVGIGTWSLRRLRVKMSSTLMELALSAGVGFGLLAVSVLSLGLLHLLYEPLLRALGAVWIVAGLVFAVRSGPSLWARVRVLPWRSDPAVLVIAGLTCVVLVMGLLRALAPPHGATDPLAYQLALPKIYLEKHFLSFEQTINGTLYPSNVNMLYVVALALRGGALAQVLHWLMGVLCCLAVAGLARSQLGARSGIWGAALFCLTPVVVFYSSLAYVDVGLCFFQLVALWSVLHWCDCAAERQATRQLFVAAMLTGFAMGAKVHGLATLLLGGALVFWYGVRRSGLVFTARCLAFYGAVAVLIVSPWYVRSYLYASNPVWPVANDVFGGLPFGANAYGVYGLAGSVSLSGSLLDSAIALSGHAFRATAKVSKLWDWSWRPMSWQHAIGVYYVALLPTVLLVRRNRRALRLALLCAVWYLLAIAFLGSTPRYFLVLFALSAALLGSGFEILRQSRWRPVAQVAAIVFLATAGLQALWSFQIARPLLPVILGTVSEERFLQSAEPTYGAMRFVSETLPADATVLFQGVVKGFYCDRRYLWDHPYQRVLVYEDFSDEVALARRLEDLGITHVVRLIRIPPYRKAYPQYFADPFHERFRKRYLSLLYRDEMFVVFAVDYSGRKAGA